MKLLFIRYTYVNAHAHKHPLRCTLTHTYTYSIHTAKSSRALCKHVPVSHHKAVTLLPLLCNSDKMSPPSLSISYFHMAFSSNWCVFPYQIVIGHRLIWFRHWELIFFLPQLVLEVFLKRLRAVCSLLLHEPRVVLPPRYLLCVRFLQELPKSS